MKKIKKEGKKETLYSFWWNLISKSITYVVLLALANFFTVEAYGKATYALAIFYLAHLFLMIGLPQTFVSWCIKRKDSNSVVYFLTFFSLFFSVIGLIVFWGHWWVFPLIVILPFFVIKGFGESFFRVERKYHFTQIMSILVMVFYLLFLFIFKKSDEGGIVLAFSLAYFVVSLIVVWMNFSNFSKVYGTFRIKISVVKQYLKKGVLMMFIGLSFAFLGWIDSFILGSLSIYENVANYSLADSIAGVIVVIPLVLSMFLLTRSAEVNSEKKSRQILKRVLRLSFSLSLLLAIILISFIQPLLGIFFPKYILIGQFVMILLFSSLFYAVYFMILTYYSGKLKPEIVIVPMVVAAILNVVLDVLLIPSYGVFGITVATSIAHFFAMFWLLFRAKLNGFIVPIVILSSFVYFAYYLAFFGVFLIILTIPLLFLFKLLTKGDVLVCYEVIKNIFVKNSK